MTMLCAFQRKKTTEQLAVAAVERFLCRHPRCGRLGETFLVRFVDEGRNASDLFVVPKMAENTLIPVEFRLILRLPGK
jgi:hypothetical protein